MNGLAPGNGQVPETCAAAARVDDCGEASSVLLVEERVQTRVDAGVARAQPLRNRRRYLQEFLLSARHLRLACI